MLDRVDLVGQRGRPGGRRRRERRRQDDAAAGARGDARAAVRARCAARGTLASVEQELDAPHGATVGTFVAEALAGVRRAPPPSWRRPSPAFDHEPGDLARLTAAVSRYEHLAAWDADRRVDEALTRFGAPRDPDRRLDQLSVGERYRVRLACRIGERADLLLLDEPTNHLDAAGIDYLTARLREWPGAVVIVTHDRRLLDDVMTAILDLDPAMDGRPALYGATRYSDYRFLKSQMVRRWQARYRAERKRAIELAERLDSTYENLSDEWRPPKGSQKHRRATRARGHVKAADRLIQKLEAEAVEVPDAAARADVPRPAVAAAGAAARVRCWTCARRWCGTGSTWRACGSRSRRAGACWSPAPTARASPRCSRRWRGRSRSTAGCAPSRPGSGSGCSPRRARRSTPPPSSPTRAPPVPPSSSRASTPTPGTR